MSQKIFMFFLIATIITPLIAWAIIKYDSIKKLEKRRKYEISGGNSPGMNEQGKSSKPKFKEADIKEVWGIEDVRDGIVYLKNGRYSAVLRVGSIDFGLLSSSEQEAVENVLIQTALSFNCPVQFFSTTDFIDTMNAQTAIISALESGLLNQKLSSYAENLLKFLDETMRNKSVYVRKNYIIVSYDGELHKAKVELARRCEMIANSLKKAKVTVERLSSEEIVDLIHNILNKANSAKPSDIVRAGGFELYVSGINNAMLMDLD